MVSVVIVLFASNLQCICWVFEMDLSGLPETTNVLYEGCSGMAHLDLFTVFSWHRSWLIAQKGTILIYLYLRRLSKNGSSFINTSWIPWTNANGRLLGNPNGPIFNSYADGSHWTGCLVLRDLRSCINMTLIAPPTQKTSQRLASPSCNFSRHTNLLRPP